MSTLIRDTEIAHNEWSTLRLSTDETAESLNLRDGQFLFPLSVWLQRKQEIISRYKRIGLWLAPDDEPEVIANDLHYFIVIGIDFPKFSDGRGYSSARILRERLNFEGELRAIGDVQKDQLFYLKRCGFDAFALKEGQDAADALSALDALPEAYQAGADQPAPLFRRRPVHSGQLVDVSDELQLRVSRKAAEAVQLLQHIAGNFQPAVFANSLGAEDQVLTDLILKNQIDIGIFSIDTGRLPAETYELMAKVEAHYGVSLNVYYPKNEAVQDYVRQNGINGFYHSVEQRKSCCHARKVEPLRRALAGKKAWITGLRAQQSATRTGLPLQEFDAANGLEKFNPLSDWTEKEVWAYLKLHGVPYNALHDQHYPSIGCAPCTRAISAGEDIRAGRWWWESADTKECGLHRSRQVNQ